MSSAKTKVESRARIAAATEADTVVEIRLMASFDAYVKAKTYSVWKLVDDIVSNPGERNIVKAIDILRKGLAKRNNLEWKGKTLDPEYVNFTSLLSKIKKVVLHGDYDAYRKSGKSLYQCYDEIMLEINSKKHNMNVERMEKRATKANNYLNEKMDRRKKLLTKKKETEAWVAPAFDADREWRKATWEIVVGEPVLFNRYMAHIARKRPKEFTAMLRYIVDSDVLPENIEIVIH